jgi:signal transduction histidine kinase
VIATEVRAPLEAIRDATHGLARDADSEERSAVLVQVDAQVERLNRLVNDILTYARPVAPEMQPIDVRALVEAAIARVRSLGTRHAAAVKSALHGSEARIHGDPDLLRRAIDSVVDHVVAAMPGGGEFVVRLEKATLSGQPALSVVFHDAEAPSAAEPREHAPPFTTADARGLKLGLAIVERVVHVHGGKLTIRDGDGDGALVTMTFPRRRASTETERARA